MMTLIPLAVILAASSIAHSKQDRAQEVHPGKLVYDLHCARCHGPTGLGDGPQGREMQVRPPNFQSPGFLAQSNDQMLNSIEFGEVRSQMHAWRGRLTEQQMHDVLGYIRQLGRPR